MKHEVTQAVKEALGTEERRIVYKENTGESEE